MEQAYQLSRKRLDALQTVDLMPGDLRKCVHEFGLPIVTVLRKHGIRDPRHIREIVREIWAGARQDGQRVDVMSSTHLLLAHGIVSVEGLCRFLSDNNRVIVSVEPTRAMLDASMAEVSGHNLRVTKEEKHRLRLRAALRTAIEK